MRAHRSVIVSSVFAALFSSSGIAAPDSAAQALLEQGRYWQNQNDSARATQVWKKLLVLDPQQIDAIYNLGLLELKAKRLPGAKGYLDQLRAIYPGAPQTLQLEQAIALQTGDAPQRLEDARLAAESGELDKAIVLYRQLLAGKPPQGDLALEFYGYLGYASNGWNESRQGLERLLQQQPDDAKVRLVLAKLLIRNEATRIEGIRRLAQLSTLPELGGEATESWRQALLWLGPPRPAEVALFEGYLKAHPDDSEIRTQLTLRAAGANAPTQQSPLLSRGFKALQDNQLDSAEQAFQARLKEQPQDADAMGGLGVVRQRQGRFGDANELLGRAVGRGGNPRWQQALDANRYWALLAEAGDARAGQDLPGASRLLQRAIAMKPRQIEGLLALASLQAEQGQPDSAQAGYRQALNLDPDNAEAVEGLVTLMARNGQASEAMRMVESLSAAQRQRLGDLRPLRAAVAVGQAQNAERAGNLKGAIAAQQDAVRNDPQNPWTRYDLARLYVLTRADDQARKTVDELLKVNPRDPQALYVSALLASQLNDWAAAQRSLAAIPAAQRTPVMKALARDVQVQSLAQQASTLVRQGERQQAVALLRQGEASASDDQVGVVAQGYVEAGQAEYALAMLRKTMAQSSAPSPSLRLAYVGLLLKTGDDVQASQILHELQGQPLQPGEQRRYEDAVFQYSVRQADQLREKGDLVAAYDTLAPSLAQRPKDPQAVAALARMHLANNDPRKAITLYQPLVSANPQDPDLQSGLAQALSKAGERRQAEEAMDKALQLAPNDPQILTTAAGLYRAHGKSARAAELYSRAVALQAPVSQPETNPFAGAVAANPFVGLPGQRSQSRLAQSSLSQIPEPAQVQLETAREAEQPAAAGPGLASRTLMGSDNAERSASSAANQRSRQQADPALDERQAAQQALAQIRQERSPQVTQGVAVRSNNSESGLSKLTDVQAPLEVSLPVGDDRLALRVTPVWLNAGGIGDQAQTRFGSGQLNASNSGSPGAQKDDGIGLAVAYENPELGLKGDVGTSPMGFLYSTVVGGISLDRSFAEGSNWRYGLNLSRRSVTDSLVSFAGARDARSGLEWGGVTANGARLQVGYDNGDFGVYGGGAVHKLVGNNVEDNSRVEAGAGSYWYLLNDDSTQATAGINATAVSYDKNQSFFTYGNGGYFSPQNFFSIGFPVSWSQRTDRLSYSLRGSVGLQHIEQDSVPYFPNDNDMQSALQQTVTASGASVPSRYASQNKTGLGYNLSAAAEYRMGSNFFLGGNFGLDNARDYKQWSGGVYLRYMFEDFAGLMALPVSPYRSPYSNQ
ncbi:cellulose synthase [Pseudomonas floridensis]|uniref:Cellulose synthase n=1 Tax=Pseudomonas floridensis TaxID=1958950 RepID=A0A1X0NC51_9PSED|nr:cellulose synthase subunit BcsC-related outer membrane protein [Pseudomonas floridensis]ORC61179.1 cellulose synthase [Pseudomonas floridensis]